MADIDDLDARLTAVENRLDDVDGQSRRAREDSAAARVLAGAADRDVSEMRSELQGHTRVLNALRETQLEHQARFDRVDGDLADLRRGFGVLHTGMNRITEMLTELLNRER
ncbi:hypothetical protein [Gordonia sp. (in: high G+C Gram-positive bacteria)]|jgi:chromosome segregation ATPase|uniref:hypothetical protein n=1 Tax=Gordonia sp. (in: high G+C Gram-positive bacteria) TaxID=84139 RepID=UPI001D351654|nr:hypothetical protein [Gordonia sp. (in: high G+C Gram-positive bacteria)]MCB1296590.1 hypothetical protein [Gordonia sp. (in: high G+C Gram-positive bacteria)]HMS74454.1 hypothetical protein [Gordonia sp. (in: high G+C Gram-positive bacteria)]HQV21420.1 hypothetical protein [Gordonia sp. (in: high G+C Gram-positive bacteria)]